MLLVYGPRSVTYDFGPGHPLTPRRFGPGIELLRAVGAEPGLAPEPAPDDELLWCHSQRYIDAVKRFSVNPFGSPEAGIGEGGDDPPFAGMHDAGAMVAGGSIRAVEAILRGDVEHAFHPGGGLHHAMPDRASGFCIYDDPALAIARARRDGLRVLYVDLDVHHGDGVQAIHWSDPGVLTVSVHESGRYLFPGTGGVGELGEGAAAGTSVNVPLEPETGEGAWLAAVQVLLPELAAAFGPDLIVSQHGADSHAWDPLAHLRVTTTAMGEAARLVDRLAHGSRRRSLAGDRRRRLRRVPGRATDAGASSGSPARIGEYRPTIGVRHLAVRAGQPDQLHDRGTTRSRRTRRLRSPASGRRPIVRHPIDEPGRLAHRGRGHPQVREGSQRVGVGAVLRHDEVGPERGGQLGEQRRIAASHAPSPVSGLERHVDGRPGGRPLAQLIRRRRSPGTGTARSRGTTRVSTPGSSQWIAWTPSPWWTSKSTYRTRRPSRRARAMASAGSS